MLCVCVVDVMDVVFSVCIVMRVAVGARVWEVFRHADVVCLCFFLHLVAVLNAAVGMTCSLLMLVEDARGLHAVKLSQRSGKPCANCVDPSRPQQWGPDYSFLGKPAMWTRWMDGNAPHKIGRCRD